MKKGFTLAEVLITLAIIGVVAALTIPSVIINAREQGNITAFKKAVSVLNSAISLSIAVDMTGPSQSVSATSSPAFLMNQLISKMNVISQSSATCTLTTPTAGSPYSATGNCNFITADGMQFIPLPKNPTVSGTTSGGALQYTLPKGICHNGATGSSFQVFVDRNSTNCATGTPAGTWDDANTKKAAADIGVADHCSAVTPCFMIVDVNGVNAPNNLSDNIESAEGTITDRFAIAITGDGALAAGDQAKAVMSK